MGEYNFHTFKDYCDKYGIRLKVTIPGNLQINGVAEQLRQTLHGMASVILKESDFPMRYNLELILTSNYLCNRLPVVCHTIILYEAYPNISQIFSIYVRLANAVLRKTEKYIPDGSNFKIAQLKTS